MKILVTSFNNRNDLEKYIIQKHGKTLDRKPDVIVGSRADLNAFQLNEHTHIWGCQVKVLGEKKKISPQFG